MIYRAWLLAFLFSVISTIFIGRLFYLQIIRGHELATEITQDRHLNELVPARRGRIVDRHGEVIVDNRNIYNLSLVLNDLCLSWRETKRHPFYKLDQEGLTHLRAELSMRIAVDAAKIESVILEELEQNPGVAIRYQKGDEIRKPEIIAIPRSALQLDALTSNEQEKVASLFEQRLIGHDIRQAISTEVQYQRQNDIILFNHQQLLKLSAALNEVLDMGDDYCKEALLPFLPNVHIDSSKLKTKNDILEWYCIDADHIDQAITHLSRFTNVEAELLRSVMLDTLDRMRLRDTITNWYFAPSAIAQKIKSFLPQDLKPVTISIDGLPPNRERIYIIQGDNEDDPGFLSLMFNRIQSNLDITEVDWLRALFEEKAERISAFRSGRLYRKKQIALDYERTRSFIQRLAATLDRAGLPCNVRVAESYVTDVRRLSDKEWQGLSRHHPITIVKNIPRRIAIGLSGSGYQAPKNVIGSFQNVESLLPGLRVTTHNGREYLFPGVASHLIGYLGRIDSNMSREEALSIGLDPDGLRGRGGLEGRYDHVLQGSTGVMIKKLNERSRQYEVLKHDSKDPLPGQDLRTTIDAQLQQHCTWALKNWYQLAVELGTSTSTMEEGLRIGKGRAGIVIMDVKNGAVLSMASAPGYDLDNFNKHYSDLLKDHSQPLLDNATIANRHPGSVVKILVAVAGLHEGKITPSYTMECNGYMALDSRGNKILRDHAIGTFNVSQAIAKSSNKFFATVGAKLGPVTVLEWYKRFGMGEKYAYDIPWQRVQTLPSPQNIEQTRPREPHWNNYDTWSISIGQFIKVAPLEVITIPAFVANGGTIVKPHLVPPSIPIIHDYITMKPSHLQAVRRGMEMAVESGTVPYLRLSGEGAGIKVAAKTGTAQWGRKGNPFDHSWLIGYAPADNPKVCFAIFVHSGSSGGRACAPIAKTVLEKYFEIYGPQGHRK